MDDIRILLVDARTLVREGIKQLLVNSGFDVVDEASDLEEACDLLAQNGLAPDVVLFEFVPSAPVEQNSGPLGRLRQLRPTVRIVALSDTLCIDRLTRLVNGGVDGFLMDGISPSALRQSIQLVMLGEKVFPTALAVWLARRMPTISVEADVPMRLNKALSKREMEILRGVMHGHSNKQIANELDITEGTVKVHLKGILKKINARNRTQAAVWALNHGMPAVFSE